MRSLLAFSLLVIALLVHNVVGAGAEEVRFKNDKGQGFTFDSAAPNATGNHCVKSLPSGAVVWNFALNFKLDQSPVSHTGPLPDEPYCDTHKLSGKGVPAGAVIQEIRRMPTNDNDACKNASNNTVTAPCLFTGWRICGFQPMQDTVFCGMAGKNHCAVCTWASGEKSLKAIAP